MIWKHSRKNIVWGLRQLEGDYEFIIKDLLAKQDKPVREDKTLDQRFVYTCPFHGDYYRICLKCEQDKPVCKHKFQETMTGGKRCCFCNMSLTEFKSPSTQTTKHLDKLVVPDSLGGGLEGIGDCIRLTSGIKMWDKINQLVLFNKQLLISLQKEK